MTRLSMRNLELHVGQPVFALVKAVSFDRRSVGYASMSQTRFEKAEKLFEAADFALYSAKQQGRNRVVGFQSRRTSDRVTVAS